MKLMFTSTNNEPRFDTIAEFERFMQSVQYIDFDRLMGANQVYNSREGSCHDQVMLEIDELRKQGLEPKSQFIMAVDQDNIGGETHTFVYYIDNGKFCWFENAWEDYRGIHEFDTEQELLDYVIDAFMERNPHNYIFMSEFIPEEHRVGEDLNSFVDICMADANQV